MVFSLHFEGRTIGTVTLEPSRSAEHTGLFRPGPAYLPARAAIQSVTLGLLERQLDATAMRPALRAALDELERRGLALVDAQGAVVATRVIIVGDYMPPEMATLPRGLPPIPVSVEFTDVPARSATAARRAVAMGLPSCP